MIYTNSNATVLLKIVVVTVLLFFSNSLVWSQEWSKEDSLWLQNVLEGKEEIKINEETKKAIEEGRFMVPQWMREYNANPHPEISKDLDGVSMPDDSIRFRSLDMYTMPPAVFALYVLYVDKMDSVYQAKSLHLTDEERKVLEDMIPTGTQTFHPFTSSPPPGTVFTTDFNHLLSMVFSSHYRQIQHNRKHANAYKNYNNTGFEPSPIRFSENEKKQLNRLVSNKKPTIKISHGTKTGGIDN